MPFSRDLRFVVNFALRLWMTYIGLIIASGNTPFIIPVFWLGLIPFVPIWLISPFLAIGWILFWLWASGYVTIKLDRYLLRFSWYRLGNIALSALFYGVLLNQVLRGLEPVFPFEIVIPWLADIAHFITGAVIGIIISTRREVKLQNGTFVDNKAFGSAAWAMKSEILPLIANESEELPPSEGIILGKFDEDYLRLKGEGHLITVAGTGSGKGAGCVIPTLLSYQGSTIVIDLKGENYAVTAKYRKEVLGQKIMLLDPFGVCRKNATDQWGRLILPESYDPEDEASFNPLDFIDSNDVNLVDDAAALASAIIEKEPQVKDPHWNEKAKALVKGMIIAVLKGEGLEGDVTPTLTLVRQLLLSSASEWENLMAHYQNSEDIRIRQLASQFERMAEEERGSVFSNILRHLECFESDNIYQNLHSTKIGNNPYHFVDFKGDQPVTIYLVLPPDDLDTYRRILRLWVMSFIRMMVKQTGQPKHRVLFLLDEMAQLGTMDILPKAISLMRGYGMTLWPIIQDIPQLKALYPKNWQTFFANTEVQQFFGIHDLETAKYLSQVSGNFTIQYTTANASKGNSSGTNESTSTTTQSGEKSSESVGHTTGSNHSVNTNYGINTNKTGRALIFPDEVRRLPNNEMIILANNYQPIKATKLRYFTDMDFQGRAAINPFHANVADLYGSRSEKDAVETSSERELLNNP